MPKYDVKFRNQAKDDMKNHVRFLANVSIPASRRLQKEFYAITVELSQTPLRHHIFYKNFRKAVVAVRYIVMYEVVGQKVFVDKILDARSEEYNSVILDLG